MDVVDQPHLAQKCCMIADFVTLNLSIFITYGCGSLISPREKVLYDARLCNS